MDVTSPKNKKQPSSLWVLVNSVNIDDNVVATESDNKTDSDPESDGISIISESSHLHESNTDEEDLLNQDGTSTTELPINTPDESDKEEKECNSDPKEGSPTKWTLVRDAQKPDLAPHEFYLNCLQEPVIEISDNDMDSINSETSDILESNMNEDEVESLDSYDPVQINLQSQPYGLKHLLNNSLFMAALILVISFLVSAFLSEQIDEENMGFMIHDEHLTPKDKYDGYENVDLMERCIEKYKDDQGLIGEKINNCVNTLKSKQKKKPTKMLETDILQKMDLYLRLKERLLEVKERDLILREMLLLEAELGIRKRYKKATSQNSDENEDNINDKPENIYYKKMFSEPVKSVSPDEIKKIMKADMKIREDIGTTAENLKASNMKVKENFERKLMSEVEYGLQNKHTKEPVGPEVTKKYDKKAKYNFNTDNDYKYLKKNFKMKESDNKNHEEFFQKHHKKKTETKDDFHENLKKFKTVDHKKENYFKKKNNENKEPEMKKYKYKNKYEDDSDKSKYFKKEKYMNKKKGNEEKSFRKEKRLNKENKIAIKNKNGLKNKNKWDFDTFMNDELIWFLIHSSPDKYFELIANLTKKSYDKVKEEGLNSTLTGNGYDWYMNMHKGREDIRKKEHSSDWYFDRSYMRKLKRMDKAKWYFDWMSYRDKLRYIY